VYSFPQEVFIKYLLSAVLCYTLTHSPKRPLPSRALSYQINLILGIVINITDIAIPIDTASMVFPEQ
jgi:hypothetical protein